MADIVEITTTVETEEQAQKLADHLVEHRIAACVQITGPIQSVYRWQGKLCKSPEFRCTIKSLETLIPTLMTEIQNHHPYDVPEILVVKVVQSARTYEQWLQQQLVNP